MHIHNFPKNLRFFGGEISGKLREIADMPICIFFEVWNLKNMHVPHALHCSLFWCKAVAR